MKPFFLRLWDYSGEPAKASCGGIYRSNLPITCLVRRIVLIDCHGKMVRDGSMFPPSQDF